MQYIYLMFCFVLEVSPVPRVSLWLDLQFKVNLIMKMGGGSEGREKERLKCRSCCLNSSLFKREGVP